MATFSEQKADSFSRTKSVQFSKRCKIWTYNQGSTTTVNDTWFSADELSKIKAKNIQEADFFHDLRNAGKDVLTSLETVDPLDSMCARGLEHSIFKDRQESRSYHRRIGREVVLLEQEFGMGQTDPEMLAIMYIDATSKSQKDATARGQQYRTENDLEDEGKQGYPANTYIGGCSALTRVHVEEGRLRRERRTPLLISPAAGKSSSTTSIRSLRATAA